MNPTDKFHIRYFHYLNAQEVLFKLKGKKILDAGCGRGELTRELFKKAAPCKLVACDIDKSALQEFKNNISDEAISFVKCDVHKLPFKNQAFDAVLMFDVLEHLKHPDQALSEIYRVLKPGELFHLVVPCEADLFTLDGWVNKLFRKNLKEKPIGHIQQFTYKKVLDMLAESGFAVQTTAFSYYFLYQFISLVYFAYANLIKGGKYIQLVGFSKPNVFSNILVQVVYFGAWLTNLETQLFQFLPFIRGQEAHITSMKI